MMSAGMDTCMDSESCLHTVILLLSRCGGGISFRGLISTLLALLIYLVHRFYRYGNVIILPKS